MKLFPTTVSLLIPLTILLCVFKGSQAVYDANCYSDFTTIHDNYLSGGATAATLLYNLTVDLCYQYVESIPTGMKPTVCSFTAMFALPYVAALGTDEVDEYATDYCTYIDTAVNNKVHAIQNISNLETTSSTYETDCTYFLANVTNKWFDPIIPYSTVTYSDMCIALQQLFTTLTVRGMVTNKDFVVYTYVLLYSMYLTAQQESVYQTCVDQRIQLDDDSYTYCQTLISTTDFTLWSTDNQVSACSLAEASMQTKCESALNSLTYTCYPCAYTVSYIFTKYESYITQALENIVSSISYRAVTILYATDYSVSGDLYSNSSLAINYAEDLF